MTLKGNSCIYFEYDVYLLNYTIKIKNLKIKFGFWGFKKPRFLKPNPTVAMELGPHLTQCGLSRGLPPYQVAVYTAVHSGRVHGRTVRAM